MTSYAQMQAKIANELSRNNLEAEIKDAINTAIEFYASERFWFNQTRAVTFNTVAGQRAYGIAAEDDIENMSRIDAVLQTQNSSIVEIGRISPLDMDLLHTPNSQDARPSCWAWIGDEIHFWPTPDAVYATRMIGVKRYAVLAGDNDENPWLTYAANLIRYAAKRILYADIIRDTDQAGIAAMAEEFERNRLGIETLARMPRGKIQATQF